jgi:catechol 2,3-dioxygenase-like lactoylglutathione lyase family enzyme
MLSHNSVFATIAVRDIEKARTFYQDILGLKVIAVDDPAMLQFETGDTTLYIYRSPEAGTYGATVATWFVEDDIEGIMVELSARGIKFEHMDNEKMPRLSRTGDLHTINNLKVAWFRDPDGNLMSLFSKD